MIVKFKSAAGFLLEVWRIEDSWLFVISRIYSRALHKKYALKHIVLFNCQVLKQKYPYWSNILFTWKEHNVFCSHSFWLLLQSHFGFALYILSQSNILMVCMQPKAYKSTHSVDKRQLFCHSIDGLSLLFFECKWPLLLILFFENYWQLMLLLLLCIPFYVVNSYNIGRKFLKIFNIFTP